MMKGTNIIIIFSSRSAAILLLHLSIVLCWCTTKTAVMSATPALGNREKNHDSWHYQYDHEDDHLLEEDEEEHIRERNFDEDTYYDDDDKETFTCNSTSNKNNPSPLVCASRRLGIPIVADGGDHHHYYSNKSSTAPILPSNLEHSIEFHIPIGFRRLRRAMLSHSSEFWLIDILQNTFRYKNISIEPWTHSHHHEVNAVIGEPNLPQSEHGGSLIGATRKIKYDLPRSIFVPNPTAAYETSELIDYNDSLFAIKRVLVTPKLPFGENLESHTQIVVLNTGKHTCKMICSVEARFPRGIPFMCPSTFIKNSVHSGFMNAFELMAEKIRQTCAVSSSSCS